MTELSKVLNSYNDTTLTFQLSFFIQITLLFTLLIHLRNIHMLSSVRSILFIISCEIYQTENP
ncbi:hypothetical protein COI41_21585 [Bacillus toyonensis]|nr:hypothetical protein CN567_28430 [Bacillus toyonensis]PFX74512.1 hypothetical protein COL37_27800 [Bacillus toyonensis]PFX83741.1 hypothetical protein COL38_05330 [Bacillus toyonensis]PGA97519.1 hypothetical protein COL98_31145 [Bacillus toyonensis]PHF52371.1 hypothetical protein COI41_21585 [Bacillus toyonensis]